MASICFYFQVHQPLRINPSATNLTDIFASQEGTTNNREILKRVVERCYIPATTLILELLNKYPNFKVSYSISGVLIDQLEKNFPEVIELLKKINETGRIEFLDETYFHSLSSIYSKNEFLEQIKLHRSKIKELFNQTPETFRNTEIIYSDNISELVKNLGYKTIVAEGADRIIGWQSPNYLFNSTSGINLLLKNYKLSDDIAFKFSDVDWFDHPITADKFSERIRKITNVGGELVNLFMDYETLGEHNWKDSGIFEFFKVLIDKLVEDKNTFINPFEAGSKFNPKKVVSMSGLVSWADLERDTSAWDSNEMQKSSLKSIYSLEKAVKTKNDENLIRIWRYLQTSDHFYYMSTKDYNGDLEDQAVHTYFSPFESPKKAYESYQNALKILKQNL